MQITEIDAKQELEVLAALIYNDKVLAAVANTIEREAFKSQFSYQIAARCLKHYEKYHKAPKFLINNYIEGQIENSTNREESSHLQQILSNLAGLKRSVNGKNCNNQYWIDRSRTYLHRTRLGNVFRSAKNAFDDGSFDKMESLVSKLSRVAVNGNGHTPVDLYLDKTSISNTFNRGETSLFTYNGQLGQFFGNQFARENFVAFQGPEKSFKSFWMQEICHQALMAQLRVMFIGIGDMSLNQYCKRFYSRVACRPWSKGEYWFPIGWEPKSSTGKIIPKREKRTNKRAITAGEIKTALDNFREKYLQTEKHGKYLRMMTLSAISIAEIETIIRQNEDVDSWTPDVLIIDYVDRLTPPKGIQDRIAITDHNWNRLRDIALEHHNLVVTATQAKRFTYKGFLQTRDDVADSKTKTAVATGLIGICATEEEYKTDTRRLNWIVCREHTQRSVVTVAACPAVSRPAVLAI